MVNRHMKKVLNITNHQGNANKTTMRYHLKSVRMAIMKIQEISVGEDMEKREPLCTVDGNVN